VFSSFFTQNNKTQLPVAEVQGELGWQSAGEMIELLYQDMSGE